MSCLTSLDPLRPLLKMGRSHHMYVTSCGGPPRGQETELKNDLFPLNVHSLPHQLPALVPKEAGQGGGKAERKARQVISASDTRFPSSRPPKPSSSLHPLFKKLF